MATRTIPRQSFLGKRRKIGYWDIWARRFKMQNFYGVDIQTVHALMNLKLDDNDPKVQTILEEFFT